MTGFQRFDRPDLTPRAREILAAVERAAAERRRQGLPPGARIDPALLRAVELAVAGLEREQVAGRLLAEHGVRDPGPLLDAVFGAGSAPSDRLRRAARHADQG